MLTFMKFELITSWIGERYTLHICLLLANFSHQQQNQRKSQVNLKILQVLRPPRRTPSLKKLCPVSSTALFWSAALIALACKTTPACITMHNTLSNLNMSHARSYHQHKLDFHTLSQSHLVTLRGDLHKLTNHTCTTPIN